MKGNHPARLSGKPEMLAVLVTLAFAWYSKAPQAL
jgi:hypothetical protein